MEACAAVGGSCATESDGFYLMTAVCTGAGVLWMLLMSRRTASLQDLADSKWHREGKAHRSGLL